MRPLNHGERHGDIVDIRCIGERLEIVPVCAPQCTQCSRHTASLTPLGHHVLCDRCWREATSDLEIVMPAELRDECDE